MEPTEDAPHMAKAIRYAELHAELEAIKLRTSVIEDEMKTLRADLRAAVPQGADTLVLTTSNGTRLRVTPTSRDVYSPSIGRADMFWTWAKMNGRFDLVQRRLSSEGVEAYARDNGSYPPFIEHLVTHDTRITITKPAR